MSLRLLGSGERWAVYCGDSAVAIPHLVAVHGRPDHLITDPPYSERTSKNARSTRGKAMSGHRRVRSGDDASAAFVPFATSFAAISDIVSAVSAKRWSLVFCDVVHAARLYETPPTGTRSARVCIWDKPDSAPQITGDRPAQSFEAFTALHSSDCRMRWNAGGKRGTYRHHVERGVPWHPTPKPLGLMREIVRDFTDPGDLVFDVFGGSGTTAVAAIEEGRRVVVCELSPEWAAKIVDRIEREARQGRLFDAPVRAEQRPLFSEEG